VMRIATFGATGRIGRHALARAQQLGHTVTALSVTPPSPAQDGVAWIRGDVRDGDAVDRCLAGVEAIVAALGPRANTADEAEALEVGMRIIVAAASEAGVRRIVTLSGAGISVPGDDKPLIDRVASAIVRRMARYVVAAKQREYEVLAASELDWTALRPPLVVDGAAQGYRLASRLVPGARVRLEDVGHALVDVLTDASTVRTAPFVLPPDRRNRRAVE
ncbi:MAG: NAD(P)H-binding protein, partial [Chloroflexota bacterium]|nr:NAD(P)H-binding protein [Chloroflexota bacterium]